MAERAGFESKSSRHSAHAAFFALHCTHRTALARSPIHNDQRAVKAQAMLESESLLLGVIMFCRQ